MATRYGTISEFDNSNEDWTSYTERLQHYFSANEIEAEGKQKAILLSCCGPQTYQLVKNLLAPDKPADKTYAEIVLLVKEHLDPKPSIIVQRFIFHSRTRKESESVAKFVAELKRLSEHCGFGDTLHDMLRDRLVCGINDGRIQRRLLSEADLTYKRAFDLAQAVESAERNAHDLQVQREEGIHAIREKPFQAAAVDTTASKQQIVDTSSQESVQVHTLGSSGQMRTTVRGQGMYCYRCGGRHQSKDCSFKEATCFSCHKRGHIAKVCRSRPKSDSQFTPNARRDIHFAEQIDDANYSEYDMFSIKELGIAPLNIIVSIEGKEVEMEIDTGATKSIISKKTFDQLWTSVAPTLQATTTKLRTYTGEMIKVIGEIEVEVTVEGRCERLSLLIVEGVGPSLLGRDWLARLKINFCRQNKVCSSDGLQRILASHTKVFNDELGNITGVRVKIYVDPDAPPKFCRARTVPYALRGKVEQELSRLEEQGVIEPVCFADWASPVVPVVKSDGKIRICGDYKVTINQASKIDHYPLPRIDDLLASLAGGKYFSKLDLAQAYLQISLEEGSKKFTTINTHKGLYQYNRLPFGISSAPAIFQRTIENILRGIPRVCVYLDDILITGKDEEEHLCNLNEVLTRLENSGFRLKRHKCVFLLPSVDYLGHTITAEGIKPNGDKIQAVKNAPRPTDVSQLRSFLGLMNYYGKFLPNMSSILAPLYGLLQKREQWVWGSEQESAFGLAKDSLMSDKLLVHFDPEKDLVVHCDASPYGLGAVLSHRMPDGSDKPVYYASRSLSSAEKGYSQLDKEGLAIVFAVKKFHHFLYGRHFAIYSDHKPLQHIFSQDKPVPSLASARLQRWALLLGAYDYRIEYRSANGLQNADGLSRLPLSESPKNVPIPGETVLLLENLDLASMNSQKIKQMTDGDPLLSRIRLSLMQGCEIFDDVLATPFKQKWDELSVQDGCILRGSRVVIPGKAREAVMDMLHEGHPGISRMKSLARGFVWWPGMDAHLEERVKKCEQCQFNRHSPAKVPLHPWEWPRRPWGRVHIDYAGPFLGKMFLLIIDAYSKWIDISVMNLATSQTTIEELRKTFAIHGLPEVLVSDNGTAFSSGEFVEFTKRNGIRHIRTAPYHPSSNGQVERAVQTFKEAMKKDATDSLQTRVSRFLFNYRNTPHSTTGVSPAELLLGRQPRTHLSLLIPSTASQVARRQEDQKRRYDTNTRDRSMQDGDKVLIRDFTSIKTKWIIGKIMHQSGPMSYNIKLDDGRMVRRHKDHVRPYTGTTETHEYGNYQDEYFQSPQGTDEVVTEFDPTIHIEAPPLRRSQRVRYPTKRYQPED